jgi:hypothetical protein
MRVKLYVSAISHAARSRVAASGGVVTYIGGTPAPKMQGPLFAVTVKVKAFSAAQPTGVVFDAKGGGIYVESGSWLRVSHNSRVGTVLTAWTVDDMTSEEMRDAKGAGPSGVERDTTKSQFPTP